MKIGFSPLVSSASGRAADMVAASWKGRAYIRKWVRPANPQSAAQTLVRDSMADMPALYRSLDSTTKGLLNRWGAAYRMSGWNVFVRSNRALYQADPTTMILMPPNPVVDKLEFNVATGDGASGTMSITWTDPTLTDWTKVGVCALKADATVFAKCISTTLASAETLTLTDLTPSATYNVWAWLYNPETKEYTTPDIGSASAHA